MTKPTPTPPQYPEGSVKQDPDSLSVAVRLKDGMPKEWGAMTTDLGGRYLSWDDVEGWSDMKVTPTAAKTTSAAARRKKT